MVEIFTDGACQGNPGPGGWGVLLRDQAQEKQIDGCHYGFGKLNAYLSCSFNH